MLADTVSPVYLESKVAERPPASTALILFLCFAPRVGPTRRVSPTVSTDDWLAENAIEVVFDVIVYVPESVPLNADDDGQILTFNEFPSAPGYFAIQLPTLLVPEA